MISDEDKDRVRAATDLVALVQETVQLRPRGREFWGCCPFHGEKTPSFHIIPATQVWHCFGCGEGGDCFTYVMKRENLSFPESIRYLADRAGIEIADEGGGRPRGTRRGRLIEVCEETARFYHTMLMRGRDGRGREYCKGRLLDAETCRTYRLGYAPGHGALVSHLSAAGFTPQEMIDADVARRGARGALSDRFFERVMFPIFDEQGHCIAFGGRALDKTKTNAKYLNSSETAIFHKKRNLYGFNWAKEHITAAGEAIVVEGYISAMTCWKAGIQNLVACLGTALTANHVKTITRFANRIVYLFDGDAAGQKAAERALSFIESDSVDLRCVVLPDGMDPDDYVRANGGDALRALVADAIPLLDFVFGRVAARADTATPGGRAKALEDACRLLYPLRASYLIDDYYMRIADLLGVDASMVRDAAPRVFREVQRDEERERQRARFAGATAAPSAPAPADDGEVPDGYVPDDYLPADAAGAVPAPAGAPAALTDLERRALAGERELLTLLTSHPDSFRPFAERITEIEWIDPRDETIAWAVLATPEGTAPAAVMDAARAVCPEAAQLVSAGTIAVTSAHPTETNIAFLLDTLELYTLRRRLRATQARLRSDRALASGERRDMTVRATRDAARLRELARAVEGVADPFRAPDEDA